MVETSELPVPTEQRPAVVLHQSSDQYDKDPPTLKKSADGMVIPFSIIGGFALGYGDINSGDRNNRSKNLHRSNSSWSRRSQSKRRASQSGYGGDQNDREDGAGKRKADEEGEVSSKMSRHNNGLMVHQKPSNPQ